MGFCIVKGDLLKQKYDAIVVPSQPSLRLEGMIGAKIEKICGEKLQYELDQMKCINISECVITNAYRLECKKIIHVATPKWDGGGHKEEYNLKQSYLSCLEKADDFGLDSIAFPLLSTGAYKFPKRRAIEIAIETITDYLEISDLSVALVIRDESIYKTYKDLFKKYEIIGGHLDKETKEGMESMRREIERFGWYKPNIEEIIANGPEAKEFKDKLLYLMSKHGLTKSKCYTGIISKTSFNNILNGAIPKKSTVISLGINMGLDVYEINELLKPLGEILGEFKEHDQIITDGIYKNLSLEEINANLVSEGYPPLKTY